MSLFQKRQEFYLGLSQNLPPDVDQIPGHIAIPHPFGSGDPDDVMYIETESLRPKQTFKKPEDPRHSVLKKFLRGDTRRLGYEKSENATQVTDIPGGPLDIYFNSDVQQLMSHIEWTRNRFRCAGDTSSEFNPDEVMLAPLSQHTLNQLKRIGINVDADYL
jgi:hypothetical protein